MWRLLYPLTYLSLANSEKRHIDLWPTLVITILIAAPFAFIPHSNFFHGFVERLLLLTSALTGFYVAALVAVATFPNPDMDKVITVGVITRKVVDPDGNASIEHLTRREFSCAIFGYLAFSALMLSVIAAAVIPLCGPLVVLGRQAPWIGSLLLPPYYAFVRGAIIALFAIPVAHLIVATCLGLYYLTGRVYRRDPQVVAKKPPRLRVS